MVHHCWPSPLMRQRLDQVLVRRGLVASRARARDLILRGQVRVDGAVVHKPALSVNDDAAVEVKTTSAHHVSRGGEKLSAALEAFGYGATGRTVVDIGASTGGFCQVLLEQGAQRVYAVDVGHDQLHDTVRNNGRVVSLEGTDARTLSTFVIEDPVDAVVADVSFISLTKVLPAALRLAQDGAWLVALIKPQFEAGREHIGKGGIVRDESVRRRVCVNIEEWISTEAGWQVDGVIPSPIKGGSGNQEFLIGARKGSERRSHETAG